MNHFETHFSFTQLRRKPTKEQHSAHHILSSVSFSPILSPLSLSILSLVLTTLHHFPFPPPVPLLSHPMSRVCVPVLCILTVSVSHVSPQLSRTAGSSWWISLTTNCGCLCPMCHSPMRDAMCASSTQILLRKPTQTSLSWVGVRTHVWTSRAHTLLLYFAPL